LRRLPASRFNRAQAAHQQAAHMVGQIERRLHNQPLRPHRYRDFGSLVSLGTWSTICIPHPSHGTQCRPTREATLEATRYDSSVSSPTFLARAKFNARVTGFSRLTQNPDTL